jgi:aryl-alcohol dehydrogenase-like predicted oxidoreductase
MRSIGDLSVSVAGLGGNPFGIPSANSASTALDARATASVVDAALDVGINHFDTADVYGADGSSEEFLGRAISQHRDEIVLVTKFGFNAPPDQRPGSGRYIEQAIAGSLRRLGTDRVDLYLMHRPDPSTPIGETLIALDALVAAGKIREYGCSEFTVDQLDEAAREARSVGARGFVNLQSQYNVVARHVEDAVLPRCRSLGVAFVPYQPLAGGLLTGKHGSAPKQGTRVERWGSERGAEAFSPENVATRQRLETYAADRGHTLLELALSYLATTPGVASVIAGATSPEHVRANAAAISAWAMTEHERAEIRQLTSG